MMSTSKGHVGLAVRWRLALCMGTLTLGLAVLGSALAAQAGAYLYWTSPGNNSIGRANLDGSNVEPSFIKGANRPQNVAVNSEFLYWSNETESLGRALLGGSGVEEHFISDPFGPDGVAVDSPFIFWASTSHKTIAQANLNGTSPNENFIKVEGEPTEVAANGEHVYWANPTKSVIGRANVNGTGIEQTLISGENEVYGLAIFGEHLYWADAQTDSIARANLNGGEVDQELIETEGEVSGVAVDGEYIYWLNVSFGEIGRAKINGTGVEQKFINIGVKERIGLAVDAGAPAAPTIVTGSESEVKPESLKLSATVNPNGVEVSSCLFEYGTTESYGSHVACSPSPGSGESPVAVSAALSGLSPHTSYHYRVSATNSSGETDTADRTFTTPASSESATTFEPSVPAKAVDGALSGTASEGVGTVTVGAYESDPAGPPPYRSSGVYSDAALAAGSTFKKLEFKNCDLKGAKNVWWANGSGGWQPVSPSAVVYTASPGPCVTVTITESTSPDLAQMTGTRFGYGKLGSPEFGKCEATKDAIYSEAACGTIAEKKGKPSHKGKYEWFAAPVGCYAQKDGNYTESGCRTVAEKKGAPDHKGKYEKGTAAFTGTLGAAKFAIAGTAAVECTGGSTEGELGSAKTATERITFTGCKQDGAKCQSTGEPAETIHTSPLESFVYPADKKAYSELTGNPIMAFNCGAGELTLTGTVSGEAVGETNAMNAKVETIYKPGLGEQALDVLSAGQVLETGLTLTETNTSTQPQEIDTRTLPAFVVAKEQRLKGETLYTQNELVASKTPVTVEYLITVTATGETNITLEELKDANCEHQSGPSKGVLQAGESATYTCEHTLTTAGTWTNTATVKASGKQQPSERVETEAN